MYVYLYLKWVISVGKYYLVIRITVMMGGLFFFRFLEPSHRMKYIYTSAVMVVYMEKLKMCL